MSDLKICGVSAWFETTKVLRHVSLECSRGQTTAIIGPSGCGKSTFLRCINRMHELAPGARATGEVLLAGASLYSAQADPTVVRRRVGMVFDQPCPFPTMSIRDNVMAGFHLSRTRPHRPIDELVETTLSQVELWADVRDRLDAPGRSLPTGQQQQLCIARALALNPEALLFDDPCAALDSVATNRIEQVIQSLRGTYTIMFVTHNLRQAARVSQQTAFMLDGQLVEVGETGDLFTTPQDPRTEAFLTGKFDP